MDDETLELICLLGKEVDSLTLKLDAIDNLLESPYAKNFSEAVESTLVDDVLRYKMMIDDITKFLISLMRFEINNRAFKHLLESTHERLSGKDSTT